MLSRGMLRIGIGCALVILAVEGGRAQDALNPCSDSLDPVLAMLAMVTGNGLVTDYDRAAFSSGAVLTAGWTPQQGLHIPLRQRLLWIGNHFLVIDSLSHAYLPLNMSDARKKIRAELLDGHDCMILSGRPLHIVEIDTSFGEPWYFVASCEAEIDTTIWDASDFRHHWWWWAEEPGANSIWVVPAGGGEPMGQVAALQAIRHAVLAARPDSSGDLRVGLAALRACVAAPDLPGAPQQLAKMSQIRAASARFLTSLADLWPPSKREPIKLAAYYLQKNAAAWQTLAVAASGWRDYDATQRSDLLAGILNWETRTAVALDEIVTGQQGAD